MSVEASAGVVLLLFALAAFIWGNCRWADQYAAMKQMHAGIAIGGWHLHESLVHWVNDGLMAVFFFVVGLEIKRELLVGELSDLRRAGLGIVAALGGMLVPAGIFAGLAWGTPSIRGWGVPMATDIAFALGTISLLGNRVPSALKVLLTALAIVDDLGAVLVIAIFYTHGLSLVNLAVCVAIVLAACVYGRRGGGGPAVYCLLGVLAWYFMLKSGVHATVAGVLLAMTVPIRNNSGGGTPTTQHASSPLHRFEDSLHPWVAFVIMPVFAFFNAGVSVTGGGFDLAAPHLQGAFWGLLIGKPVGIVLFSYLGVRLGLAALPEGIGFKGILCIGLFGGIGFTMSLFIANLAFGEGQLLEQTKMAVLLASLVVGCVGLFYTRWVYR
jgi:NhaA family Na+:H+ antiporter